MPYLFSKLPTNAYRRLLQTIYYRNYRRFEYSVLTEDIQVREPCSILIMSEGVKKNPEGGQIH